jgi:uncharacterized protein YhbP (UPF0306 family)
MRDFQSIVRDVLSDGYIMSLGTIDQGGVWVCDLVYVYDDELNIYWLSRTDTRHSRAIEINPQVAGSISVSRPGEEEVGIQFSGIAEKLSGDFLWLAEKHREKKEVNYGQKLKERFWLNADKLGIVCDQKKLSLFTNLCLITKKN